jgi:hypothetical protein
MKKIVLIFAIVLGGVVYNTADAQLRVSLGFHFGPRPVYVPARVVVAQPAPVVYNEPADYDGNDDYYYLPDVDAYYSVPEQCYYYNNGGAWVSANFLPGAYRNFDWRNARRFEVRAPRPFMHADFYRSKFGGVAFNGRWNERMDNRGYVNAYHDDHRFDEHGVDRFRDNHSDRNNIHGREGFDRGDHRPGRS